MRTMRSGGVLVFGALVASVSVASALSAQQRDPYPATLQFGTGLINIPVAWVSPNNADIWLQTSGKTITYAPGQNFATKWNSNISLDSHWLGRFSVGASAYSQNPEWGFFGQVLAIKPGQFAMLPSLAVGVRNVGKYDHEDRLLIAHDIALDPADSTYKEDIGGPFADFKTSPSFYGVATQGFNAGSMSGSFSLGYGNGLFSDDGDLGDEYNAKGQLVKGLFLGARAAFHPSLNSTITVMAENDGWDWNAGIVADWRGITLGLYGTELEEGGKDITANCRLCQVYNYTKFNVSLGYSGNIIDISRGVILRTRITDLTREQSRLRSEISVRERRIRGLEVTLRRAQAGELAEIAKRRQELESQIQAERDAIQAAMKRLEALTPTRPPTTPPPTTPPSNPPSNPPQTSGSTTLSR
jgi:hypothetical protein